MKAIQQIIFDFDGVIMNSIRIKRDAFAFIFKAFPKDKVEQLLAFHDTHGGVSRFVKVNYFFNEILHQKLSESEQKEYTDAFSRFSVEQLMDPTYLIEETMDFLKHYSKKYSLHIASGAYEEDLKKICQKHQLEQYFLSIHGSPTPKEDLVKMILSEYHYSPETTILIGDSLTDFEASEINHIRFYGYNNESLRGVGEAYLEDYSSLT